jgi:predicted outer membrane repeat protein
VIIVAADGSGETTKLSEGLARAQSGDSLLIFPGDYVEEGYDQWGDTYFRVEKISISLLGTGSQPDEVRIRAKFLFVDCDELVIENVMFEDSTQPLFCARANVTIRSCRFENNGSVQNAGGGAIVALSPMTIVLEKCVFLRNFAGSGNSDGGAINTGTSLLTVRECVFIGNSAQAEGGAIFTEQDSRILDSVFIRNAANSGGAVAFHSVLEMRRCTFFENSVMDPRGAAITALESEGPITHCIVARTKNGYGIDCQLGVDIQCCDVWGNESGEVLYCWGLGDVRGNDSIDPLFCDPEIGDVGLMDTSPCLDWETTAVDCGPIGALGAMCGTVGRVATTWGQIKTIFRK